MSNAVSGASQPEESLPSPSDAEADVVATTSAHARSRSERTALAQYFAERPAWTPILRVAVKRYRTYNGLRGQVSLDTLSAQEVVRAIGAQPRGRVAPQVTLEELDRAFRATRFACGLVAVLEVMLGEPLLTRHEAQAADDAGWAAFREAVEAAAADGVVAVGGSVVAGRARARAWLDADEAYLRSQQRARPACIADAGIAARALGIVTGLEAPIPLPVLAQRACHYPHGLDADTSAGRYFERAVVHTTPETGFALPLPDADARELVFAAANVAVDDVSSAVAVFNLDGDDILLQSACAQGFVVTLPLATVDRLSAVRPRATRRDGGRGRVYVVENPAVFSTLVRWALTQPAAVRPTLVCTSGQLSLAARRLLARLVAENVVLHYGGDFDHMGLVIARSLMQRWPAHVHLWRMTVVDYEHARAAGAEPAPLQPERLASLRDDYPDIVDRLVTVGPAYQEALLAHLQDDLTAATLDHARGQTGTQASIAD